MEIRDNETRSVIELLSIKSQLILHELSYQQNKRSDRYKKEVEYLKAELLSRDIILRKLLWINHATESCGLYGDDGEMQCNTCGIDFKRDTPEEIENRLSEFGLKRLAEITHNELTKQE